jgi:hypothetical protein
MLKLCVHTGQDDDEDDESRASTSSGADRKKASKRNKQLAVKGPWSKEEDDVVVRLVGQYGPKRWSLIASNLPGKLQHCQAEAPVKSCFFDFFHVPNHACNTTKPRLFLFLAIIT